MKVKNVFGVKKEMVLSYLSASKQGKSALVNKHIPSTNAITIGCSTNMTTKDIYSSLLRQLDIKISSSQEQVKGSSGETLIKTTFKAMLPFFGEGSVEASGKLTGTSSNKEQMTI